jgi:hypothetical protein
MTKCPSKVIKMTDASIQTKDQQRAAVCSAIHAVSHHNLIEVFDLNEALD